MTVILASVEEAIGEPPAGVKEIVTNSNRPILLVTLGESYEATDEHLEIITKKLEEKLPGYRVLVVPPGVTVKAFSAGMVYHRERLEKYEVEIVAQTEEELKSRLALIGNPVP